MNTIPLVTRFLVALLSLGWRGEAAGEADALRAWTDYRVILWIGGSIAKQPERWPRLCERLREMGVDTAMVSGADGDARPCLDHGVPYYVENIVNKGLCLKWNSKVTDWDQFVTAWAKNGRPAGAFVRDYCLDDPTWLEWARGEMRAAARRHGPNQPLAYDIRDELSVTVSANPFDYDFSPKSLAGFRDWLRTRHADLAALNAAWGTRYGTWDEVEPFSTDAIKHRMVSGASMPRGEPDWRALQRVTFRPAEGPQELARWNFAPWCEFRTYMDIVLARTLDALRRAAHEVDPRTPVGIEGTQMPQAFGGYDLARLAGVLDWVEPYDIGNAREILGSFMPGRPILATVFEAETNPARRRLWHLLLEGDRGCIVWWSEDCLDWGSPDLALTAKARALAPVLRELGTPLARLFLRAERERDPIYLHYSQPSIQVNWLIESTVDGSTWPRRFSSFESAHNQQAKVRNAWIKALQDLGWSPQFLSTAQLEQLRLGPTEPCTVVLPRSWALSDREAAAIASVVLGPGLAADPAPPRTVLASGPPGWFDERGRLQATNRLASVFPTTTSHGPSARHGAGTPARRIECDVAAFPAERLKVNPDPAFWVWLRDQVSDGPVKLPPHARARVHRFRVGEARLLAIERNIDYHMSEELQQAGGNEALEQTMELTAQLSSRARPAHVYDLRAGRYLGRASEWRFTLDPWQPSLFALLPEERPAAGLVTALLKAASNRSR